MPELRIIKKNETGEVMDNEFIFFEPRRHKVTKRHEVNQLTGFVTLCVLVTL